MVYIRKSVGAGQWDLSVAEHLTPGETYRQACLVFAIQYGHTPLLARQLCVD